MDGSGVFRYLHHPPKEKLPHQRAVIPPVRHKGPLKNVSLFCPCPILGRAANKNIIMSLLLLWRR